jgi:hypothetical protein
MARVGDFFQRVGAGRPREGKPEAQVIPAERMAQVQGVLRRRVSDAVEDAFHRACLAGDIATAGDLIGVLEGMGQRGHTIPAGERRLLPGRLQRLRRELERCGKLQAGVEGDPA